MSYTDISGVSRLKYADISWRFVPKKTELNTEEIRATTKCEFIPILRVVERLEKCLSNKPTVTVTYIHTYSTYCTSSIHL